MQGVGVEGSWFRFGLMLQDLGVGIAGHGFEVGYSETQQGIQSDVGTGCIGVWSVMSRGHRRGACRWLAC